MGVSFFYHRILTHKTYIVKPFFEKLLTFIALPAGTPIQWVGTHLKHHKFTDVSGDPHSPNIDGFFFAHCGWYINQKNTFICIIYCLAGPLRMLFDAFWRPRNGTENNYLAVNLLKNNFFVWVSKPHVYNLIVLLYLSILTLISLWIFGVFYGTIFLWISLVLIYNLGDSVNSLAHLDYFSQNTNKAINNNLLSILTFGEGFHKNHHNYPSKFFTTEKKFTLTNFLIYLMEKSKLIKRNRA